MITIKLLAGIGTLWTAGNALLAQAPMPEQFWNVAAQSGFNAVIIGALFIILRKDLRELVIEQRKTQESVDRATVTVTELILGMAFLPKAFHKTAEKRAEEVRQAQEERRHRSDE